jgi:hypothetical protein
VGKSRQDRQEQESERPATLRERIEVGLVLAVLVLCLLLFVDFLFIGWYVK